MKFVPILINNVMVISNVKFRIKLKKNDFFLWQRKTKNRVFFFLCEEREAKAEQATVLCFDRSWAEKRSLTHPISGPRVLLLFSQLRNPNPTRSSSTVPSRVHQARRIASKKKKKNPNQKESGDGGGGGGGGGW